MCIVDLPLAIHHLQLLAKKTKHAQLQLLEKAKKNNKKNKLTALMSTSHVDLLIDSCISSIVLFLTQDLVQAVLTSTFSFFVFSFFSFSCP